MSRRAVLSFLIALAAVLAVAPAALASPGRIAWFYKPPTDGASAGTVGATTTGQMILTKRDETFLQQLRGAGYGSPILQYIQAMYVHGPSGVLRATDSCNETFAGWGNNVMWDTGDFCRYAHPNEDWFLHNDKGERLIHTSYTGGHGALYAMNPGSSGWRQFYASRVRQALFGDAVNPPLGYNGIFLDDVWMTRAQLLHRLPNADGTVREFSSDADFRSAVIGLVQTVQSAASGRPVLANTDGNDFYRPYLDGTMREDFAGSWNNTYMDAETIAAVWAAADRATADGKQTLLVSQGARSDTARVRFSYAAYLMVASPSVSFRYSHDGITYRELWTFPEFALDLGTPAGARTLVSGSTWRRQFSNGVAVANLSATSGQIVDLGGLYVAADGALHTTITLPARTGAVLVRVGDAPPPMSTPTPAFENVAPPQLTGTAQEGTTISATDGEWSHSATFRYAWLRCDPAGGNCTAIPRSPTSSYKLVGDDAGSTVRVQVTATSGGGTAAAVSSPTEVVAAKRGGKPRARQVASIGRTASERAAPARKATAGPKSKRANRRTSVCAAPRHVFE